MFERFTDRARKVMALANQEARRLRHVYIAPEHVLLGLLREGAGVGANVLREHAVNLRALRAAVANAVPPAAAEEPPTGRLPQTQSAKRLIERTIEEARNLQHDYVGTEHLLLALLGDDGIAGQLLRTAGVDYHKALATVEDLIGRGWEVGPDGEVARAVAPAAPRAEAVLRYTYRARNAFALAREEALRRGSQSIEPRHLLLGVLQQDGGGAAQVLRELGVNVEALVQSFAESHGSTADPSRDPLRSMAPRAKAAIRIAILLAEAMGGAYVGTEHLLAALMFVDDGVRVQLTRESVSLTLVREKAAEIGAQGR